MIWLLLISCIQIFWSKTLDISCRLFRTLWDGKIFGVYFHRHDGSYSLSVVYSRYSSPLASSFFKATSSNLICLASCRCLKWTVSENHRTRKYFRLMNAKLVFFKNAFNIFVCQSYCGVRFGSFTRVPGVWLSGLFSIPWILRPWGCLLSHCCPRNRWILREKEDIVSNLYILNCPFSLRLYENCMADCSALLGEFPRPFVFRQTHLEISEIRLYRRLFSSRYLPVVGL